MIKWSKNYLMGIDKLDEEHKELFRISDQIYNKVMERGDDAKYRLFLMNETLEYMLRYFKRHAKGEEIYMREIGYAGYEFHKMLHDEFYNMLLKKKADIVKRNECSKKEIAELVGDGIGWLLEHIITEDMAIVGKGISAISSYNSDFEEQLKNVINTNLISFLNVAANVKIINRNYQGEDFGKVICQKMVYNLGSRQIVVISGIEKTFLIRVAEMIYGIDIEDEMDLVLYSMQTFGANFWRAIGQYFVGNHDLLSLSSNSFIIARSIPEELDMLKPEKSLLFLNYSRSSI
ncbi:hemerythrin family protein [Lachnospiraceae bacterium CLA-AA-H58]|uniref:bacteriohemerythrin n=1 Tax=Pilosibacter fragilis TaxID=3078042 RepID=UPI0032D54C44